VNRTTRRGVDQTLRGSGAELSRPRPRARRVACLAALALVQPACGSSRAEPDQKIGVIVPAASIQLGGAGFQAPHAISASPQTLVVSGAFDGSFNYAGQSLGAVGGLDGFVVAMSPAGELRFLRQVGGDGDDDIRDVQVEPSGNILVAGHVTTSAILGDAALDARSEWTALVAELSSDGSTRWALTASGAGVQDANAVAIGPDGSIYCAGDFTQTLSFGDTVLTADGRSDAYLAKFSSAGEPLWLRAIGGAGTQSVHELHVGSDGAILVSGGFQESLAVGGARGVPSPMIDQTPFVASFLDTGELAWLNSELVFINHDHAAYLASHDQHSQHVSLGRVSVSEAAAGSLRVAVAYEELSGLNGEVVAHPAVSTLSVLELATDGARLSFTTLESSESLLQLGGLSTLSDRTMLGASWTGSLDTGSPQHADGPRSLLVAGLAADGQLSVPRQFSVEGISLTATDVAAQGDTFWTTARWSDVASGDVDALVLSFQP